MQTIIIGTRGSQLALAQAQEVKARLRLLDCSLDVELRIYKTEGDRRLDLALASAGSKGLFTTELEQALLEGEIDIAVHSLKDLPVEQDKDLYLSAILPREEPADVLLGQYRFDELPEGAIVGTSSPRRIAQLLALRPNLDVRPIRGNVETRIRKMKEDNYDAIVMARAGLRRLGLESEIVDTFEYHQLTPAPGQAAIAIQQRVGDERIANVVQRLSCPTTSLSVELERELLQRLGGGCALPLGCLCRPLEDGAFTFYIYYKRAEQDIRLERRFAEGEQEACLEELVKFLK